MTITYRNTKGVPLTFTELDNNFLELSNATAYVGADSTSLQSAITAHSALVLPAGTINTPALSLTNNVYIAGKGSLTVLKQSNNDGAYVLGLIDNNGQGNITIKDLTIDGSNSASFTGTGHGVDLRNFTDVYIDNVEITNCAGHGLNLQNCKRVVIGYLHTHNNKKFGCQIGEVLTDGTNQSTQVVMIGQILAHDNGWSGLDFGDSNISGSNNAGPRQITIGEADCSNNGAVGTSGGNGIALGRNANVYLHTVGGHQIAFGTLNLHNNEDNGIEIYGADKIIGGSIYASNNHQHGVAITQGDLAGSATPVKARNVVIGQLLTHNNNWHGTYLTISDSVDIGQIISKNNNQNTGNYAGVSIWQGTRGSITDNYGLNDIHFGSIETLDDQTTKTQQYGFWYQAGSNVSGPIRIDYLNAHGNNIADLRYPVDPGFPDPTHTLDIGRCNVNIIMPSYANSVDGASSRYEPLKVNGKYITRSRTTDANLNPVQRIAIPSGGAVAVDTTVFGRAQSNQGNSRVLYKMSTIGYDAAGTASIHTSDSNFQKLWYGNSVTNTTTNAVIPTVLIEHVAGTDAVFVGGGASANYLTVSVQGINGINIHWDVVSDVKRIDYADGLDM